jgi:hypothetical protein
VAAFPGGNGLIAYASYQGDPAGPVAHIFTIRPDGSGLRQLTNDAAWDGYPSWSADGRRLVFTRHLVSTEPGALGWGVFTINADGGEPTMVVDTGQQDSPRPRFSPSGDRIIYTTSHSIRTIRPDGTDQRRVLGGFFFDAQYSPNGRRILFDGTPAGKKRAGFWTARRDGSDPRRLPLDTPESGCYAVDNDSPDYSPDGRHIVFRRYRDRCGNEIRVIRADGSHERVITDMLFPESPAYAPAGDRIVLPIADGAPPVPEICSDLYTISPTGSDIQNITNLCTPPTSSVAGGASWQPDPPGFSFAGVKANKRRGTAKLRVAVPVPGVLELAETAKVKGAEEPAEAAGEEELPVKPTGKAKRRLNEKGEATVQTTVTYTPDGGEPNTQTQRVRLVKRR